MSDFRDVDPRELRPATSRRDGADPIKLHRQIARFGASTDGMPPLIVYEASDRATKKPIAKIVLDYEDFIKAYETIAGNDGSPCPDLVDQIKKQAAKAEEILINALAEKTKCPLDYNFDHVLYTRLEQAKICLYDIRNQKYVNHMIVHDHGNMPAPLAGYASKVYKLPTGEVFYQDYKIF